MDRTCFCCPASIVIVVVVVNTGTRLRIPGDLADMQPMVGRDSCAFFHMSWRFPCETRITRGAGHGQVSCSWNRAMVCSKESSACTEGCILYRLPLSVHAIFWQKIPISKRANTVAYSLLGSKVSKVLLGYWLMWAPHEVQVFDNNTLAQTQRCCIMSVLVNHCIGLPME